MWVRDPRFKDLIRSYWNDLGDDSNFLEKLNNLKNPIRLWNKHVFGNVDKKLTCLRDRLSILRQLPCTEHNIELESKIVSEMDEWLCRAEIMWQQQSRVSWLQAGDNNISFFHRKACKLNTIYQLRDTDGILRHDQNSLQSIAFSYFSDIFSSGRGSITEVIQTSISTLPKKITESHNNLLMMPYTERDIYAALQQVNPSKAPGLDGFPAEFLQRFWNTVRTDFVKLCLSILNDGYIPANLNDTLLVLIPKQKW
ncbi:hypothetical protein QQ045_026246 [Rhodiola kirilowii]